MAVLRGVELCEDWGTQTLVSTLLFSFVFPPSFSPLPLEIGPLKCSQGSGYSVSSPNGIWAEPQPKSNFVHFYPQNLTSSGNDFNEFPDNQLVKFRTV